ncbi:MAG TPA: ribonuclease Z [Cytophagales bacterium]|nr:ribonuclease Z [Cytophagales bacterium]
MSFEITILGSGSASPRVDRMPSAHHVKIHNHYLLIDCGEGAQFQMMRYGLNLQKLDYVCITHLHGDHIFGLIGLISTLSMWDRRKTLQLFSPPGLKEIVLAQLDHHKAPLNYSLDFVELDASRSSIIIDNDQFQVLTVPLSHGIECVGYVISEKTRPRNIIKEKLPPDISISHIRTLKRGEDVTEKGKVLYRSADYTHDTQPTYSYAYLSDTKYHEAVLPFIHEVTVLYHEATFLEEHSERAGLTMHSTVADAAKIASLAKAKKLIIGHFSSRYDNLDLFVEEGKKLFDDIELAVDGLKMVLRST